MKLVLFLAWLPYIIALYPGNLRMDTSIQLTWYYQYLESGDPGVLSTHHPLFDTIVFGTIINTIYTITGNIQAGVFTLTLLQVICTAIALSIFFVARQK